MNIFEKIKEKIKLAKTKFRGKRFVYLQKPVQDISYEEALIEFNIKEKTIFEREGNFEGRNKELIEKVIFKSRDNDFAINYLLKILNDDNITKGVKVEFIQQFCELYDDNELCKILSLKNDKVNEQFKIQIVRRTIERLPEEFLIQYFDYTNIEVKYIRRLLKNVSVEGKITILNRLKNDKIKERLLLEETEHMKFSDIKKMYEQVILYGYKEIEDLYLKKIKTSDSKNALYVINRINYISPKLANELDKVIEYKNADEVIEYINNNEVNKGSIIYLNRRFSFEDKKKVFYNLKSEEDRKKALVIFTNDISTDDFEQMVNNEKSESIKNELINNKYMLIERKGKGVKQQL